MTRPTSRLLTCVLLVVGVAASTGPAGAAETYEVDGEHSMLVFRVKHLGVSYTYGRFNDIAGSFTIDEADPAKSSVTLVVRADSVDTNSEKRDQHLRNPDFLNAKQFPEIRFESTGVKRKGSRYEVTGTFTLHGVTRPLTVKLDRVGSGEDPWGNYRTGFDGRFSIKRSDFGISYMPQGIGDEVTLLVSIEGIRK